MARFLVKLFVLSVTLLVSSHSYAKSNQISSGHLLHHSPSKIFTVTDQLGYGALHSQEASSVSVLTYRTEKLNRILNDSFIEIEEVKEEDHEDDEIIVFKNNLYTNTALASYLLVCKAPCQGYFSYSSSCRYIVFQVFRI